MDGWMECIPFQNEWMDSLMNWISFQNGWMYGLINWMPFQKWMDGRIGYHFKMCGWLDWLPFQSRTMRSCQAPRNQELSPPEPTLWLLSRIMSDQIISQTKAKTNVLQETDIIKISGKHLVMKTRLVRNGNAIMRNMYWRSNMEICCRETWKYYVINANMMQIIGSIFVCQQCRLIMDEKRAIRFESMACT